MAFFTIMEENKKQLLDAFVRKATTYTIAVRKNEMLPFKLKHKKEISFTIKPPTTYVLTLSASILSRIPDELHKTEEVDAEIALKYQKDIAEVLSVLSWEDTDFPEWYVEFLIKNLAIIDLLKIMQETALKCNPGFFLNCFQIAKASNPMMLSDSIHTDL